MTEREICLSYREAKKRFSGRIRRNNHGNGIQRHGRIKQKQQGGD